MCGGTTFSLAQPFPRPLRICSSPKIDASDAMGNPALSRFAQEHQMKSAEERMKQLWEMQVPPVNLPDYYSRISQGVPSSSDYGAPPLSIAIVDFDVP